jgi:hypothetical protein
MCYLSHVFELISLYTSWMRLEQRGLCSEWSTGWTTVLSWFSSRHVEGILPFSKEPRPTLEPIQPPIHWYLSAFAMSKVAEVYN